MEVARIDGNKWSIGIRGFGSRLSRSVLVLIDGRTVYTPLFAGTYWEVQDTLMYRRLLGAKVYIDLAGFYNHYHDLFDEEITGPTALESTPAPAHLLLPAQFRNGLRGATEGVEIAPEWRPVSYWRLRGSYSYLHMNLGKSPGSGDIGTAPTIVGSSPKHQVMVQSAIDIRRAFQFDLAYRYISSLPGQGVASYSTGDARISWRHGPVEISVVGRNLLQPSHFEDGGDPGPLVGIKRSFYAKIAWSR